jgi:hypothetical protein
VADEPNSVDEAALAAAARHALHDEELVAAYAANGLDSDGEVAQARALVERCTVCRDLHRDITAIGAGLATEATLTARAPRDFRLTAADARRLGGRVSPQGVLVSWRRFVIGIARPVGASLATFGLVGLLAGSLALGSGAGPSALSSTAAPAGTEAPAEIQAGGSQPGAKATTTDVAFGSLPTTAPGAGTPPERDAAAVGLSPIQWLLAVSTVMLVAGIVLLTITFRRVRSGARRVQGP